MIGRRTISVFVIFTFLFSNIAFAIPDKSSIELAKNNETIATPDSVVVPRDFGLVKSKFNGNSGKLIIHIQDAHCNYEAQSNIVKILEGLIKNYSLGLVSVEGADGFIDTSWFKAFPDDEVRKEVADYFMKKGEITGPEFLSITTNLPFKLFGAETRSYYIQNLNAFTSSYPLKDETEIYFNSIKTVLNRLKGLIYSEELKALDAKAQDYESKKLQFNDYIRFLQALAERHKINLRSYENFFRLVSVLIYEKKIDFNVTDKERSALIDELSKAIAKDQLQQLVTQSISFKSGKISSADYYAYLKNLAAANGVDLSKKYSNLYNYIIYNAVYSKIENEKLFQDLKKIEIAVKEKLFTNDDQRTLEKLSRHIDILLGLINIKLMNGDFDYYQANKSQFESVYFEDFMKKKAIQYGLAYDVMPPADAVAQSIPKLEDFYAIAIKRDKALVDNTLSAMKKEKQQIAVLVTGGFHSEGIAKLLEKEGVSYMVVCPSITKDVPSPYIQILTNQRTPLENILVGTAHAKEGMVAAPSRTQLITIPDNAFKDYVGRLQGGEKLALAIGAIEEDWVGITVSGAQGAITPVGKVNVKGLVDRFREGTGAGIAGIIHELRQELHQRCDTLKLPKFAAEHLMALLEEQLISPKFRDITEKFKTEYTARAAASTRKGPGTDATGTPGKGGVRNRATEGAYEPLTDKQIGALHNIYRKLIREGRMREETRGEVTVQHYQGLEEAIESHNIQMAEEERWDRVIPLDYKVHPGRGGDELQHAAKIAHMSDVQFQGISSNEPILKAVTEHELEHITRPDASLEELAQIESALDRGIRDALEIIEKDRLRDTIREELAIPDGGGIDHVARILEARLIELIQFGDPAFLADTLTAIGEIADTPSKAETARAAIVHVSNRYPIWSNNWLDTALDNIRDSQTKEKVEEIIRTAAQRDVNKDNIRIVILAGGGGTRVWPLSTSKNPKQLLSFTKSGRTMVQETIWRLTSHNYVKPGQIYIQTIPELRDKIESQVTGLGVMPQHILTEPAMADSGAAIGYAAAQLYKEDSDTTMVVLTADHIIGQYDAAGAGKENFTDHTDFWTSIYELVRKVQGQPELGTISIYPTRPDTGFGYLHRGIPTRNVKGISKLSEETKIKGTTRPGDFLEKPKQNIAQFLLDQNKEAEDGGKDIVYGWNSGMFVWDARTILRAFEILQPEYYKGLKEIIGDGRKRTLDKQRRIEESVFKEFASWKNNGLRKDGKQIIGKGKTSIDYLIMEPASTGKIAQLAVVGAFGWKFPWVDIGNVGPPVREINRDREDHETQNIIINDGAVDLEDVETSTVIAEKGVNLHIKGLSGMSVVATRDAVLVVPIAQSQKVKDLVDELKNRNLGKYVEGSDSGKLVERTQRAFTLEVTSSDENKFIYMPNGDIVTMECKNTIALSNDGIVTGIGLERVTIIRNGNEVYIYGGSHQKKAGSIITGLLQSVSQRDRNVKATLTMEGRLKDVRGILMRKDMNWLSPHRFASIYRLTQDVADQELEYLASLDRDRDVYADGRHADALNGIMAVYLPMRGQQGERVPADTAHLVYMRCEPNPAMFGSYDLRNVRLTMFPEKVCFYIGRAIGEKLLEEFGSDEDIYVVTGKEAREGGRQLQNSLAEGLRVSGINVYLLDAEDTQGFLNTPDLYFATVALPFFKAGIINTASHNPENQSGFKVNKLFGKGDEEASLANLDHSEEFYESVTKVWVQDLKDRMMKRKNLVFGVRKKGTTPIPGKLTSDLTPSEIANRHMDHIINDVRLSPEISTRIMKAWRSQRGAGKMELWTLVDKIRNHTDRFDEAGGWEKFRDFVQKEFKLELPAEKPETASKEPFRGLGVVVDIANGASFRSPALYEALGAKVVSFNDEPDSIGIYRHDPDPTKIDNLRELTEAVSIMQTLEEALIELYQNEGYKRTDWAGFSHDSDADRLGAVDTRVSKTDDKGMALLRDVLAEQRKGFPDTPSFIKALTVKPLTPTKEELKKGQPLKYNLMLKRDGGTNIIARFVARTKIGALDAETEVEIMRLGGLAAPISNCHTDVIAGDRMLLILTKSELEGYGQGRMLVSEVKASTNMIVEYLKAIVASAAKQRNVQGEVKVESRRTGDEKNPKGMVHTISLGPISVQYKEAKTGFAFIKTEMRENDALYGAEMSGHIFASDTRNWRFDDAFFAAANLLRIMAVARNRDAANPEKGVHVKMDQALRTLSDLDDDIPRFPQTPEMRIDTEDASPDVREEWYVKPMVSYFRDTLGYEVITTDGAKITFRNAEGEVIGEGLIRKSNNEPKLISVVWGTTEENKNYISYSLFKTIADIARKNNHKVDMEQDKYVRDNIVAHVSSAPFFQKAAGQPEKPDHNKGGIRTRETPQQPEEPRGIDIAVQFDHEKFIAAALNTYFTGQNIVEILFNNKTEEQYLPVLAVAVNELNKKYAAMTPEERNAMWPQFERFYAAVAERALSVEDIAVAKGLQIMTGQTIAIQNLIENGMIGAERLQLTVNEDEMLKSEDKDRGPSYINRASIPAEIGPAAGEGGIGLYWRGVEGVSKLGQNGENILPQAVYAENKGKLDRLVMYTMLHVNGMHTTVFLHDRLPGSIQHISTGRGHFQANEDTGVPKLDIKRATRGEVAQFSDHYDANGNIFNTTVCRAAEGGFILAPTYSTDYMVPLTRIAVFNDMSVELERSTTAGLNEAVKASAGNNLTAPYAVVNFEGKPVMVNVNSASPELIQLAAYPNLFEQFDVQNFLELAGWRNRLTITSTLEDLDRMRLVEREKARRMAEKGREEIGRIQEYTAKLRALYTNYIQTGRPIRVLPLIKTYPWGVSVAAPNNYIMEGLGMLGNLTGLNKLIEGTGVRIEGTDKVGESWLGKGVIVIEGKGSEKYLPVEALSLFGPEVYGQKHTEEHGAMSGITAKILQASTDLSWQIHLGFAEKVTALEQTTVYVGLDVKKVGIRMPKEEFIKAVKEGRADIFNEVTLNPGETLIVPANCPHAYRAKSVVVEFKDIDTDSPEETYSFYDRGRLLPGERAIISKAVIETEYDVEKAKAAIQTENPELYVKLFGKEKTETEPEVKPLIRLKKDGLTLSKEKLEEIAAKVENAGYLNAINPESLMLKEPILLTEKETRNEARAEIIGITEGSVGLQYKIQGSQPPMPADQFSLGNGQPLTVLQGKIKVKTEKGEETVLEKGAQLIIPANAGKYTLEALGEEEAVVVTSYKPQAAEGLVNAGFEAIRANLQTVRSQEVRLLTTSKAFRRGDVRDHQPGSFRYEQEILARVSDGKVKLFEVTSRDAGELKAALQGLMKGAEGVNYVVQLTEDEFKSIADDKDMSELLKNTRLMVLPNMKLGETRGIPFVREIESAGVILGNTTRDDIEKKTAIAGWLKSIMTKLTGNKAIDWNMLNALIAAKSPDPSSFAERIGLLLKNLAVKIQPYKADEGVRERRQLLWSV